MESLQPPQLKSVGFEPIRPRGMLTCRWFEQNVPNRALIEVYQRIKNIVPVVLGAGNFLLALGGSTVEPLGPYAEEPHDLDWLVVLLSGQPGEIYMESMGDMLTAHADINPWMSEAARDYVKFGTQDPGVIREIYTENKSRFNDVRVLLPKQINTGRPILIFEPFQWLIRK